MNILSNADSIDDEKLDALFEELENEESINKIRETRIFQLKKEAEELKNLRDLGYGKLIEFDNEKLLIDEISKTIYILIHFYKKDFKRCQLLNHHLELLANKRIQTKFAFINVEAAPFLITKLKISTLPYMVAFKDGTPFKDYIGFEKFGNKDDFKTELIEKIFLKDGIFPKNEEFDFED